MIVLKYNQELNLKYSNPSLKDKLMKKMMLYLFVAISASLGAQKYVPFPTENAEWNVLYISIWNIPPIDTTLLKYSLQGDTIINSTIYKKVSQNIGTDSIPIYKGIGGLREQNKKIYYCGESYNKFRFDYNEQLLYDFTKQVGDTVWMNPVEYYTIHTIDSIKIGNEYRKRYNNGIIEGIGDVIGGLFSAITPIPTCIDCYQSWEFVCFSQNGECVYKNSAFVDCNSTQKWNEKKYLADDACWTYTISGINYQTYLNGDTIIAGISYKKVYNRLPEFMGDSSNSCPFIYGGYNGAIREESGKIYANIDNQYLNYGDVLLYDFTAKVGDTIPCKFGYPDYVVVTNIDTVTLLNGEKRKRFIFPFNSWIEGIGSSFMLLQPQGDARTCAETSSLVCFNQNNLQLYSEWCYSGDCCNITDGINQIKQNAHSLKLSPNPVIDKSMLKWDSTVAFSTLFITDLLGKTVQTVDVRGKSEISLSRSNFNKGLYVGRLVSDTGSEATVKIIVQ
ncbi:MAG: T9SS type A sorting domain-containing protein [Paludibacter sp.]|jgi:hypothetical protein|nr:T9SS type A sorting domain-containing protein [Paludibacter sp.]